MVDELSVSVEHWMKYIQGYWVLHVVTVEIAYLLLSLSMQENKESIFVPACNNV